MACRVGTDHFHHQLGQLLLDDRTFQLQNGRCRVLPAFFEFTFIGDNPKLGHFQRFKLDLNRGKLFAEFRIVRSTARSPDRSDGARVP